MSFPSFVDEKIQEINKRTEISIDEIKRDYQEIFQDPFIQEDPQFKTDEERHRYAIAVLWTRYVSRPPVQEYEIIPVGFSGERIASTGKKTAEIYALVKNKTDVKLRRIVLQESVIDLRKQINLPTSENSFKYTVKLGEFAPGGDMIADNRAKFDAPSLLKANAEQILEKCGAKKIERLADMKKFPSKTGSDGYVDRLDWRVVRGIIIRQYRGEREDGTEFGVLTVTDLSLNEEPTVMTDGRVLQPGFSIWVAPEFVNVYQDESEIEAVGTVQIARDTGEPFMNAYLIIPVHAKKVE